jgi:glycosyltransferase involved in cell wall biosynthesis
MNRVKIVHLITGLGNGGAENMLFKLINHIDNDQFETVVISMTDKGFFGEKIKNKGIKLYTLNMKHSKHIFKSLFKLLKIVKKEKPDILQTWMYHADIFGVVVKIFFPKIKLFWNIRHSKLIKGVDKNSTIFIAKLCALFSNITKYIICGSNAAKTTHISMGYTPKKMEVIQNGFNLASYKPRVESNKIIKNELNIPDEGFVIGHVGRFHPIKNHRLLIEAFIELSKKHKNLYLILAGRNVDLNNTELNRIISKSKVSENIFLLGQQEDIMKIMHSMDVFVLPSLSEGFPNVLGEAMACGISCIASDVGDCREIIGNTGIMLNSIDKDELKKSIEKFILFDANTRRKMSVLSRERIENNFNIVNKINEYEILYNK